MYVPSPFAFRVVLPQETTSETMLAFHAPPEAVMAPVTHDAKMRANQFLPLAAPAQTDARRHLAKIVRDALCAANHIEQEVPLRSQCHQ